MHEAIGSFKDIFYPASVDLSHFSPFFNVMLVEKMYRLSHLSLKCPEEQVNISDAWFLAVCS